MARGNHHTTMLKLRRAAILGFISYIFWSINVPGRFIFKDLSPGDWVDLLVILFSVLTAYVIPGRIPQPVENHPQC